MAAGGFTILVDCGGFQGIYYGSGQLEEALEEVTARFGVELGGLASGPSEMLFEVRCGSFDAARRAERLLRDQSPDWSDMLKAFFELEIEGSGAISVGSPDEPESSGSLDTDGRFRQREAEPALARERSLGQRWSSLIRRVSLREI